MKSFLLKGKTPIIKWGMIPDETYFEGNVPEGYQLAVSPSEGYVVIDIDNHGKVNGFDNIPNFLLDELNSTLRYKTKNNGCHYWFKYTGDKELANKASRLGIDLRTHKGYVVWYLNIDVRNCLNSIKETSGEINTWLEQLFSYKQ